MMNRKGWIRGIVVAGIVLAAGAGFGVALSWTGSAKAKGKALDKVIKVHKSTGPGDTILVRGGSFSMGDPYFADAVPVHIVYLDSYLIDKYEVTFTKYDAFCDATGRTKPSDSGWGRGDRPVINISWFDAKAYCEWAGKRLPTEAEWEMACRAGTNTMYYWGDNPGVAGNYIWYTGNSGGMTHPVGQKLPNSWGLYDMLGNVNEWVADWYDPFYYSISPANNPQGPSGPTAGNWRVLRSGSWDYILIGSDIGSAGRSSLDPPTTMNNTGCRCAKSLPKYP